MNQLITMAVDAAKSPFGTNLGADPSTVGIHTMMAMAGGDMEQLALFMNQPIIREYRKLQQLHESQMAQENFSSPFDQQAANKETRLTKEGIVKKLMIKYGASESGGKLSAPITLNLTNEKLLDGFSKDAKEAIKYQPFILDTFLRLLDYSKILGKATQGATWDTKGGGKTLSETQIKLLTTQEILDSGVVTNYGKLVNSGYIAPYKEAAATTFNIYKNLFVTSSDELLSDYILKYVMRRPGSTGDTVKRMNKLKNAILTALALNTANSNEVYLRDRQEELMFGINNIPTWIMSLRNDPKYSGNALLSQLVPILSTGGESDFNSLKLFADKDTLSQNAITEAWRELQVIFGNNKMDDLMAFALLQSGLSPSPLNFSKIIPADRYYNMLMPLIQGGINSGVHADILYNNFEVAVELAYYNDPLFTSNRKSPITSLKKVFNKETGLNNIVYMPPKADNKQPANIFIDAVTHIDYARNKSYAYFNYAPGSKLIAALNKYKEAFVEEVKSTPTQDGSTNSSSVDQTSSELTAIIQADQVTSEEKVENNALNPDSSIAEQKCK